MPRKNNGVRTAEAIGPAVRKMPEPMMPPTSSITESMSERPRTSEGSCVAGAGCDVVGCAMDQPMPRSSGTSSGVPQTRQITAEQSPQVSGSSTSRAQLGQ